MYSIGSSMVMMWPDRVRLATSSSDAIVVDLPDPVGPVTSTRPRGRWANRSIAIGRPRSSSCGILCAMTRNAAPTEPALPVDVEPEPADPGNRVGRVQLVVAGEVLPLLVGQRGADEPLGVARELSVRRPASGASDPCTRTHGGTPTVRCRSEPPSCDRLGRAARPATSGGHGVSGSATAVASIRSGPLPSVRSRCSGMSEPGTTPGQTVTRMTSSRVVSPRATLRRPSSRSVTMPSATATLRISLAEARDQRQVLDLLGDRHHLGDRHPAAEAGLAAVAAADRPPEHLGRRRGSRSASGSAPCRRRWRRTGPCTSRTAAGRAAGRARSPGRSRPGRARCPSRRAG